MIPPGRIAETGPFKSVWRRINEIRDFCVAISPVEGNGVRVRETSYGSIISTEKQKSVAGGTTISQYRVEGIYDDYLTCKKYSSGSVSGSVMKIAKPWDLQKTPWHGYTLVFAHEVTGTQITLTFNYNNGYWRTVSRKIGASTSIVTEDQVIIPRYVIGKSVIYASDVEETLTIADTTAGEVTKIDLNVSGRAWTRIIS
jgi:hypothetical protein